MARIFEPVPERKRSHDLLAMNYLRVHSVTDHYKVTGEGFEVNDGKFINFVEDRKVEK